MSESIMVTSARTEDLNTETRASIIHVCRIAHQNDGFMHLFSYIPSGGIHVLAYREHELVSHAVATTRWLQQEGLPLLRTAYVDAVATLPAYQGQGIGRRPPHNIMGKDGQCMLANLALNPCKRSGYWVRLM